MKDEYQVEVVVFGIVDGGYPWNLDQAGKVPYSQRPRDILVVSAAETLAEIVDRAGRDLEVPLPAQEWAPRHDRLSDLLSYTALYRRSEEVGVPSYLRTLPAVDEDGVVRLAVPWAGIRYGDLLRARDEGLVDGDVTRPYLFLPTAFGDFLGFGWPEVTGALDIAWRATEYAATALGALTGSHWAIQRLQSLLGRTRRRSDLVEKHAPTWAERGAAPADFDDLLSLRAWTVAELGGVLGCSKEEAEAILWAFGSSYNYSDGRWYRDRTIEDKVIHGDLTIAIWGDRSPGTFDELQRTVVERLRTYLESGQVPPFPWDRPS